MAAEPGGCNDRLRGEVAALSHSPRGITGVKCRLVEWNWGRRAWHAWFAARSRIQARSRIGPSRHGTFRQCRPAIIGCARPAAARRSLALCGTFAIVTDFASVGRRLCVSRRFCRRYVHTKTDNERGRGKQRLDDFKGPRTTRSDRHASPAFSPVTEQRIATSP